jgi:hypothetical protein
MDLRPVCAKAPFATDFDRPDPALSCHPTERVRVQAELRGVLGPVKQPAGIIGQVRP